MLNNYNPKSVPDLKTYTDRAYVADLDNLRPDEFPSDTDVRNLIDDYRMTNDLAFREKLIHIFGNFVVSVAKQYQSMGLDMSDLISEGMLGLLAAIDKYDTSRNEKFITYASWAISRSIKEALDRTNLAVRVPKNIRNDMHSAKKKLMLNDSKDTTKHSLTDKERIFELAPFKYQKVRVVENDDFEESTTPVTIHLASLNSNEYPADKDINEADLKNEIKGLIKSELTKLEQKVIKLNFGIGKRYSLASMRQIGKILHISGERATQLRNNALKKLKKKALQGDLQDYLEGK